MPLPPGLTADDPGSLRNWIDATLSVHHGGGFTYNTTEKAILSSIFPELQGI